MHRRHKAIYNITFLYNNITIFRTRFSKNFSPLNLFLSQEKEVFFLFFMLSIQLLPFPFCLTSYWKSYHFLLHLI